MNDFVRRDAAIDNRVLMPRHIRWIADIRGRWPVMGAEGVGTFVARRGSIGAGAAMGAGGLVGAALAARQDKKAGVPAVDLGGQMGFLSVTPAGITLYKTKKGLVSLKPKVSDDVIAEVPRSQIASSSLSKGKLISVFELGFTDGSSWEFDVARQHRKDAEQVARALGSSLS